MPMNKSGFLVQLLRKYDNSQVYLNEADAKTVPTKDFINDFIDFCNANLPADLADVTFDQLYHDGDNNVIVNSPPVISDKDQVVSPTLCLALPTYANGKAFTNKLIREFIEVVVNDGYFLSYQPSTVHCKFHDGLDDDVMITYLTFEAKYTLLNVSLNGNLFHVTVTENAMKTIAKQGLVPKSESTEFSYPPRIFLFNKAEYDEILAYGKEKAKSKNASCFYVIRIDKSSIENYEPFKSGEFMLYRDPCFSRLDCSTDETAIFTYDKIPISLLNDNIVRYDMPSMKMEIMNLNDFK